MHDGHDRYLPHAMKPKPHMELIAARYDEGLSRQMLAMRAGLGRETVRAAEAGYPPTPRVQRALAKALDRRRDELWPAEQLPRPRQLTAEEKRLRAARRAQRDGQQATAA